MMTVAVGVQRTCCGGDRIFGWTGDVEEVVGMFWQLCWQLWLVVSLIDMGRHKVGHTGFEMPVGNPRGRSGHY